MKIKRILCLLFALLMTVSLLAGCGGKTEQQKKFETFEDFENARLGVLTGSVFDKQTGELFPDAKKYNFDTIVDLLVNIDENKIDGFLEDRAFYSAIGWEKSGYCAITLLSTVLKVYQLIVLYGISVILLGIMGFVLIFSAKRGAERWFS